MPAISGSLRCHQPFRYRPVAPPAAASFSSSSSSSSLFPHLLSYSCCPFSSYTKRVRGSWSAGIHPFRLLVRMEVPRLPFTRFCRSFFTERSIHKNKGLVEHLQQYGVIKSKRVAEVMETIDRGLFVPGGNPPYADSPMPVGYNATISAPHMHAMCLELLEEHLQPDMHALDIGSGSGYLTACFAMMVGPEGRAVGVEHIPELVASSIKNINRSAASQLLKEGSLSIHVGDGRLGWPQLAPYDAIHVGAASSEIPRPLIDQLKPGGRMVIPVGTFFQDLEVIDKKLDGSISVRTETSVRYVPLTSREAQLQGY